MQDRTLSPSLPITPIVPAVTVVNILPTLLIAIAINPLPLRRVNTVNLLKVNMDNPLKDKDSTVNHLKVRVSTGNHNNPLRDSMDNLLRDSTDSLRDSMGSRRVSMGSRRDSMDSSRVEEVREIRGTFWVYCRLVLGM